MSHVFNSTLSHIEKIERNMRSITSTCANVYAESLYLGALGLVQKTNISSENSGRPKLGKEAAERGSVRVFESIRSARKYLGLAPLAAPDQVLLKVRLPQTQFPRLRTAW